MHDREHKKLYEELGVLARFVDNARNAISAVGPQILSGSSQLPVAAAHLSDLSKMTEDGALEVMRLTELMQEHHGRIAKDLAEIVEVLRAMDCVTLVGRLGSVTSVLAQEGKYLTEIMTALSFQDLVAQRVKKLVAILDEVQGKLMKLVVVFGLQGNSDAAPDEGTAWHLLQQLEASKTTAMQQKVADEILAQFGFK
jgi:chemotaxis protein CheZ